MPEILIESLEQFTTLSGGLAVIKFTASWCGPCRMMAPAFKEIANKEYESEISFLTVDLDEAQENKEMNVLVKHIRSIPTFHFYKDGSKIDELSGCNVPVLKQKISNLSSIKTAQDQTEQAKEEEATEEKPAEEEATEGKSPEEEATEEKPAEEEATEEKPAEEEATEEKPAEEEATEEKPAEEEATEEKSPEEEATEEKPAEEEATEEVKDKETIDDEEKIVQH